MIATSHSLNAHWTSSGNLHQPRMSRDVLKTTNCEEGLCKSENPTASKPQNPGASRTTRRGDVQKKHINTNHSFGSTKVVKRLSIILILLIAFSQYAGAQEEIEANYTSSTRSFQELFEDLILKIDTFEFSFSNDRINFQNTQKLAFQYQQSDAVVELMLKPRKSANISAISFINSGDYTVVDSLTFLDNLIRAKIRFRNITETDFLAFRFSVLVDYPKVEYIVEVPLFPYSDTYVDFYPVGDDLFIGEEKIFELVTNNASNINADGVWKTKNGISYRIVREDDRLKIYLTGISNGIHTLDAEVLLKKPILNKQGVPVYKLKLEGKDFTVKQSPLTFLSTDINDVVWDEEGRTGIEVQIDYDRALEMEKTYRIEAQENPGGALIAEIFTRNRLSNGKILCWLRVFNYHRKSDGYLFIKTNDQARFLTNFNIVPKTEVNRVTILREGRDYTENLNIYPGETIEVRLEGVSLDRADFRFEELSDVYKDTLLKSDHVKTYKLKVPKNISKKRLNIYNNGNTTGYTFSVKEYQKPRPLDFVMISYDENGYRKNATFNKINSSIMYGSTLKDVIISPMAHKIDDEERLYGKQFLTIKITLTNAQRQLVEVRTIENFVVCPDQSSPRFLYYQDKDCQNGSININSILSIKTNELQDWSRVEIEISHRPEKHNDESFSHRVEFILSRSYNFDIDVSFPAGLLQIRPNRPSGDQLGSFSGVSLAALAQFSFFKPGKIAQYQPYRIGVGTIAMNAFDFSSDSADRGLALVALGSLSPTRRDPKIRLTLYFGGGYFLTTTDNVRSPPGWFLLIGPGIAVRI